MSNSEIINEYNKFINFCKAFGFPLNVKSTILQILNILLKTDMENKHFLAIFLGAKIEEIQENMISKMESYFKTKINTKELINNEMQFVSDTNFNFVFTDVYSATFGLCVELNEENLIELDAVNFSKIEQYIDICLQKEYKNIKTIVFTAINAHFQLKNELFEKYKVEEEDVLNLQNQIKLMQ